MQKKIANIGSIISGEDGTGSGVSNPTPSTSANACACRRLKRWRDDVLAKLAEPGIHLSRIEKLRSSLRKLNNKIWSLRCQETGRLPAHLIATAVILNESDEDPTVGDFTVIAGSSKAEKQLRFNLQLRGERAEDGVTSGRKLNKPTRGVRSPLPIDPNDVLPFVTPFEAELARIELAKMARADSAKATADERRYAFYGLPEDDEQEVRYVEWQNGCPDTRHTKPKAKSKPRRVYDEAELGVSAHG